MQQTAKSAGLKPPKRFGTEVVARFLKLRFNHPAGQDNLELYPTDKITRAEAAHSFAVILGFNGWETQNARNELGQFSLPTYNDKQKRVLQVAVSKIGMPYIWGGESDGTSSVFGAQAHGGYDCSGFAWRVYKLSGNPAGKQLGGRTAEAMSNEIPKSRRLTLSQVKGADLLFFGTPVDHMGIALSERVDDPLVAIRACTSPRSSRTGVAPRSAGRDASSESELVVTSYAVLRNARTEPAALAGVPASIA